MRKSLFITVALLFTSYVNAAEIAIRPGLWEVTTSSELLNFASQIPAEQMQDINDLAREYGVEISEIQNGAAKSTSCITPDMAKQKILPGSIQNQAGCTIKKVTQNGNHYRVEFTCVNAELNGNGVAEGDFINAQTFDGITNFNGTIQNAPVNEQAKVSGKWVANSCETKP